MATGSHHSSSHHSGSHHSSSHHSSSHHSSSHHSSYHHSSHHYRSGYGAPMHVAGRYKSMGYNTLYSEQEYLNDVNDPNMQNAADAMAGMPGAVPNGAMAGMPGVTPNGASQATPYPQHLVLHATTQYDANHQKVKVKDPYALGQGSEKPLIHGNSWVVGNAYCLDLDDPYCQKNHPKLKKANPEKQFSICFLAAIILWLAAIANGTYEMLIWIFENINMTDEAFFAVDNVIYYGQFFLPFIILAFTFLKTKSTHKTNLMFCRQMLQHYAVEDEKLHFDRTHEFLDICPQCGAARLPDARECPYCGTSLLRMVEY